MGTLRLALAAAAAGLALARPAAAEDRPRLGVGIGLETFDFNLAMYENSFPAAVPASIYLPLNLGPALRLEPQVGVASFRQNAGANPSIGTTAVSVGVGAFWRLPLSPALDLQLGGRFIRTWYTARSTPVSGGVETVDGADLRIVPALGGEYALHPRFSLGAEAQLQLIVFGDRTVSGGGIIPGGSGVQTAGVLFARVYLL